MKTYGFIKILTSASIVIAVVSSFTSCISITKSTLRESVPPVIEINNCEITSSGAVYMNIFGYIKADFVPASVKIVCDDLVIYCDPLIVEDTAKADYIFITHNHLDHFSKKDIDKLIKPETVLIAPKNITKKYSHIENYSAKTGTLSNLGKIQFEVVESYNTNSKIHKKGSNFVGYVIAFDTTRIYIAGDTDFIPEMKELVDIAVAIVPIGEGRTAMNPEDAAEAVNMINPAIAIPVHYELNKNKERIFLENVNDPIEVRFFQNY